MDNKEIKEIKTELEQDQLENATGGAVAGMPITGDANNRPYGIGTNKRPRTLPDGSLNSKVDPNAEQPIIKPLRIKS